MNNWRIVMGTHQPGKNEKARTLRREMTPAEKTLWKHLKSNQLDQLHFRRQQVIDGFIADFYCHQIGLVIELDGPVHENRQEYDTERDHIIAARGLTILRFLNHRIKNDLEAVLAEIRSTAQELITSQKQATLAKPHTAPTETPPSLRTK
jgi:very-short-patch-repair endonuclease